MCNLFGKGLTSYCTMPHFDTQKIYSCGKHCEKRRNCLFSTLYGTYFPSEMHFKMWCAICFYLEKSKILSSGNGLKLIFCWACMQWARHRRQNVTLMYVPGCVYSYVILSGFFLTVISVFMTEFQNNLGPSQVAQWWTCQTPDLVVVSSIPGWGDFSLWCIFVSHRCRSMREK